MVFNIKWFGKRQNLSLYMVRPVLGFASNFQSWSRRTTLGASISSPLLILNVKLRNKTEGSEDLDIRGAYLSNRGDQFPFALLAVTGVYACPQRSHDMTDSKETK